MIIVFTTDHQLSWLFIGILLWRPGGEFHRDELPVTIRPDKCHAG